MESLRLAVAGALGRTGSAQLDRTRKEREALRVFLDRTVSADKRDAVRETVSTMLAPVLREHPLFGSLAVLVSSDPRRGGWQVSLVALDPELSPLSSEIDLDPTLLEDLRQALRRV